MFVCACVCVCVYECVRVVYMNVVHVCPGNLLLNHLHHHFLDGHCVCVCVCVHACVVNACVLTAGGNGMYV